MIWRFLILLIITSQIHATGFWNTQKESLDRLINKFNDYAGYSLDLPSYDGVPISETSQTTKVLEPVNSLYEQRLGLEHGRLRFINPSEHYADWRINVAFENVPLVKIIEWMFYSIGENVFIDIQNSQLISLKQENANWLEVLEGLLFTFDLKIDWAKQNLTGSNVYRVYDVASENNRISSLLSQYQARAQLLKKARSVDLLEEYYQQASQVHLFSLSYQKPKFVIESLNKILISKYGEIAPTLSQEGKNQILFLGSPAQLEITQRMIKSVDQKDKQIFLEIYIVNVGDEFDKAFESSLQFASKGDGSDNDTSLLVPALSMNSIFDGTFSILKFLGSERLSLKLGALEKEGFSHTLSNPKLILIDGTEAKITQGIQFATESQRKEKENGEVTVITSFKDANLNITAKSRILPGDESIELDLVINNDTPNLNNKPVTINKFQISNSLIVPNGGVVAIGGVLSQAFKDEVSGIPLLKDLPFFGPLFGGKTQEDKLNELMIFIAPSIIN